jgi:hypothetical protein
MFDCENKLRKTRDEHKSMQEKMKNIINLTIEIEKK